MAEAAERADLRVSLPDLTAITDGDRPVEEFCRLACDAGREMNTAPLVVGHSGAGAFLPAIGSAIGSTAGLVFLDAVVPPADGAHSTSPSMREMLDSVTDDGVLRRWIDWWAEDTIVELLPDEADRAELEADMPRVRRSFYDDDVDTPSGWSDSPCGYLLLSAAYESELLDAGQRGWPTERFDSDHLAPYTQPEAVLRALLRLARRID